MAVSKRTRFEVLRRDNHTCRYCHATDTPLTIDHVIPTALGGTDDPSNLVAACKDCNAGKSSSSPDAASVAQVADDAVRWAAAMRQAAEDWQATQKDGYQYGDAVAHAWDDGNSLYRWGRARIPDDWTDTVERWRTLGIPVEMVTEAIGIGMRRKAVHSGDVWRYACGIVWTKLTELQEGAAALLAATEGAPAEATEPATDASLGWHNRAWRKGYLTALKHTQLAERGDPVYAETAQVSAYQYGELARVVDASALAWLAAL